MLAQVEERHRALKERLSNVLPSLFPIVSADRSIDLARIEFPRDLDPSDIKAQKESKLKGRTWGIPVYGHFVIKDKSGNVQERARVRILTLPRITPRNSFIVRGTEYIVPYLLRRRPGIYTRVTEDGKYVSQVNLARGGRFKIFMNPQTASATMHLGSSATNLKIVPIVTALGMPEEKIRAMLGDKIYEANQGDPTKESKRAAKILSGKTLNFEDSKTFLNEYLNRTILPQEDAVRTLGIPLERITPEALLHIVNKTTKLVQGKIKADDMNNLEIMSLHSIEDFMGERFGTHANRRVIKNRISRRLRAYDKLDEIIGPGIFQPQVDDFFLQNELSQPAKMTNPVKMYSDAQHITRMGPGALENEHFITIDDRSVHPSSLGFIDPIQTPESERIGVSLYMPVMAWKKGNRLTAAVIDAKTGNPKTITPEMKAIRAFAHQYDMTKKPPKPKFKKVRAVVGEKILEVDPERVDYILPDATYAFGISTNLIPFLHTDQANRANMAVKMLEQSLPLKNREAPLVQNKIPDKNISWEQFLPLTVTHRTMEPAVVQDVSDEQITLRVAKGKKKIQLYKDFPLEGTSSYFTSIPVVKKGDKLEKGDLLADTTFSVGGTYSPGTNLKVAYMPYRGFTYEDAIVVSEDAAQKLTSVHLHEHTLDLSPDIRTDLKAFRAYYPTIKIDVSKYDLDGVIKEGEKLELGDVVIAALKKKEKGLEAIALKRLKRSLVKPYANISPTWKLEDPGIVKKVIKTPGFIRVFIYTEEPLKVGDKLAGRHGNKGVVGQILPRAAMPTDEKGEPIEIVLNPLGVVSRINLGQVYETIAGKIAKKTDKPYLVRNFREVNERDYLENELKELGIKETETLTDPETNKKIKDVLTGYQYILKLDHPIRGKLSVRDRTTYSSFEQPASGKARGGGQRIDTMALNSLLAHGAKENLHEMATIKSQRNDEYWLALQTNQPLPPPKASFAGQTFLARLKASGINVEKEGTKFRVMPLTDEHIKDISAGDIKEPTIVTAKNLKEEPGGIFDPRITGGHGGTNWAAIKLTEPLPNPIFEDQLRVILNMPETQYRAIVDGELYLTPGGKLTENYHKSYQTGGKAVKNLLGKINIPEELVRLRERIKVASSSELDKLNRRIRLLSAVPEGKLEKYVLNYFPVIPPKFRPIYPESRNLWGSDLNALYRDMIQVNNELKSNLPAPSKMPLRRDLYRAAKALIGLDNVKPISGRPYKGLMDETLERKVGIYQGKLLARRQELSGRSVIIPDADLDLDEAGMPEDMAWRLFHVFLIKHLVSLGYSPLDAKGHIEKKTELARKSLLHIMEHRPVLLNRAPSLHKFSIMAFKPKLMTGKAIRMNPLVTAGFNADFDGDAVAVHVPVGQKATEEALTKLLPSTNLFSPRDGALMNLPRHESMLGLYTITKIGRKTNKTYKNIYEAQMALDRNEINYTDIIEIKRKETTFGRAKVSNILEKPIEKELTKSSLSRILKPIAKESPVKFAEKVNKLKDLGYEYSHNSGISISLKELGKTEDMQQAIDLKDPLKAIKQTEEKIRKKTDNRLVQMVQSGARGSMSQLRQMIAAPIQVTDAWGHVVPLRIRKSYAEGLPLDEYWATLAAARKGLMDRKLGVTEPGQIGKEIVSSSVANVITIKDCGTTKGIILDINDPDVIDRYVTEAYPGILKRDEPITPRHVSNLKLIGVRRLKTRSPLTCEAVKGVCAICSGLDESGELYKQGFSVGILAAQTLSEPATQFIMKTFHKGAVREDEQVTGGFQVAKQLLRMPHNPPDKALLSPMDGTITELKTGVIGGYNIKINDEETFIPPARKPIVKKGQKVKAGDSLTDGYISPQELSKFKGLEATQLHLLDSLRNIYEQNGVKIKKQIFEQVLRPLTSMGRVIDSGDSEYEIGDYVSMQLAEKLNKKFKKPIVWTPNIRGINTAPSLHHLNNDLMSRLNHYRAKKDLAMSAALGIESDLKFSPFGEYAMKAVPDVKFTEPV